MQCWKWEIIPGVRNSLTPISQPYLVDLQLLLHFVRGWFYSCIVRSISSWHKGHNMYSSSPIWLRLRTCSQVLARQNRNSLTCRLLYRKIGKKEFRFSTTKTARGRKSIGNLRDLLQQIHRICRIHVFHFINQDRNQAVSFSAWANIQGKSRHMN